HPPALHHEARHHPGVTADDDRPALLVDPCASAHPALNDHVAAAEGGTGQRARVARNRDDAGHHVLAGRPADAPGDVDLGPVDQAAAEVAEAALERDPTAGEDADADRVLRTGVSDGDDTDALLVEKAPELEVDLPRRKRLRVERRPVAVDLRDPRRLRLWL